MKTYTGRITAPLKSNQIVLNPTNAEGRMGKGFALWCKRHAGAIDGHPIGLIGQTYGIVTKDLRKPTHPSVSTAEICRQIILFYEQAYWALREDKDTEFLVPFDAHTTPLNGYSVNEMAEMFACVSSIPDNVYFEEAFADLVCKYQKQKT